MHSYSFVPRTLQSRTVARLFMQDKTKLSDRDIFVEQKVYPDTEDMLLFKKYYVVIAISRRNKRTFLLV